MPQPFILNLEHRKFQLPAVKGGKTQEEKEKKDKAKNLLSVCNYQNDLSLTYTMVNRLPVAIM